MSTDDDLADKLISDAERAGIAYADRMRLSDEFAMSEQIRLLEDAVRELCAKQTELQRSVDSQSEHLKALRGTIEQQRNQVREQENRIHELQLLIQCDDGDDRPARFTVNDAAAAAKWGD